MPEPHAPALSILIVSYNTRDMTVACLDSLARQPSGPDREVIVVDNASSDGSLPALLAHPSAPNVIALDENIGFARANNLAARAARGAKLLLLNPDTVVLDGAIDRLLDFAQHNPRARIWGGRTVFADGTLNPASAWGRITLWRLICRASGLAALLPRSNLCNGEAIGGWRRDSVRDVDIVSGCFLLVERDLWQHLGGFDPVFFMYGEEADLCLRARRIGARPATTPDATIMHHGGASERARGDKLVKLMAAKATLITRHLPRPLVPLALALHAAWPLSRLLATRALARLHPGDDARARAAAWQSVWHRRAAWYRGYDVDLGVGGPRAGLPAAARASHEAPPEAA